MAKSSCINCLQSKEMIMSRPEALIMPSNLNLSKKFHNSLQFDFGIKINPVENKMIE